MRIKGKELLGKLKKPKIKGENMKKKPSIKKLINPIATMYLKIFGKCLEKKNQIKKQENFLLNLVHECRHTAIGKRYGYGDIKSIKDFQNQVPLMQYDDLRYRIDFCLRGERDILYPGKIDRFATSSGTTGGGAKYIPVTKDNLKTSHYEGGKTLLSYFCKKNATTGVFKGKIIAIGGAFGENPYTKEDNVGFITAILQKNSPFLGKFFRAPSDETSYIADWDEKSKKTIEETLDQNITGISGSPSWVINFLYKVLEYTGKKNILEVWPNFELFTRGGMSIDLYKQQFEALIPSPKMKYYQAYNASEGFFGVQCENDADDMILLTNHGVFYEFIAKEEYGKENPIVYTLDEVELEKEYVIVITTNAGLRRYILGDTIRFTSVNPYKIKVAGRTKFYIDVVGECVTSEYTDKALLQACKRTESMASEYTAGPIALTEKQKGAYEFIVEFIKEPKNLQEFTDILDEELGLATSYYYDERHATQVLKKLIVHSVPQGTFYEWFKKKEKLGGQNKLPKLKNDRSLLEEILPMCK